MPKKCKNKVNLLGNITRDAETKSVGSSTVTKFTVATSRSFKQGDEWKEESTFTNCVGWNMKGVTEYLKKGKQVDVEGRLQTRSYDKDGQKIYVTEVLVEDIILLSGGEIKSTSCGFGRSGDHHLSEERLGVNEDDVPAWAR